MVGDPIFAGKSAVVLDDNPQMRAIMRSILSTCGLRSIAEFSDPRPLQNHLLGHHVDVAILDLVLSGDMDGLALADAIRHDSKVVNPTMPIIMVTGYASISIIDHAINYGVDELVAKPLRARDLIARVEKVILRPRTYIRTPSGYFGPDRRRRDDPLFTGNERRNEDMASVISTVVDARRAISRMRPDPFVEQHSIDESVILVD